MEAMFTFDAETDEEQIMVIATKEEWAQVLADLIASDLGYASNASITLVGEMKGWGIEP